MAFYAEFYLHQSINTEIVGRNSVEYQCDDFHEIHTLL
jgi:hypothetical protein